MIFMHFEHVLLSQLFLNDKKPQQPTEATVKDLRNANRKGSTVLNKQTDILATSSTRNNSIVACVRITFRKYSITAS